MRRQCSIVTLLMLTAALVSSIAAQSYENTVQVVSSENQADAAETELTDSQIESSEQETTSEVQPSSTVVESESRPETVEEIQPNSQDASEDGATVSVEADVSVEGEVVGVVETKHGRVQGHLLNGVWRYIDIPYGKISGVFQAPEDAEPWEGILDVTDHEKRCPQMLEDGTVAGDLNCLTISVFTPPATVAASVLFHIHDGSFKTGSGDPALYGPDNFVNNGLIVVLPNYRLGPLGFLCLDDENIPGNAALKDLSLALKWTSENIALFGGDPNNIVVSGIGMAGALAGYLALSSVSSGYISKVIASSGFVLSHWAIDRTPKEAAFQLSKIVAGTENTSALHNADWHELIVGSQNLTFRPCVETGIDGFIVDSPWKIMRNETTNTTYMLGSANYAGLHDALENSYSPNNDDFQTLLPNDLHFKKGEKEKSKIALKMKTQYFKDDDDEEDLESLTLYHTDASYLSPGIRTARCLVAAGADVYFYEFSYSGQLNIESLALPEQDFSGAARGDIVGYIFTQERTSEIAEDQSMAELITALWVNFIKNGDPSSEDFVWHKLEASEEANETWLSIGATVQTRAGLHVDRLAIWTWLYNEHFVENNDATKIYLNTNVYSISILPFLTLATKMYSAP